MLLRIIIASAALLCSCASGASRSSGGATTAQADPQAVTAPAANVAAAPHVIDSLKLTPADLPAGYGFSEKNYIHSFQATTYYESPGTYSRITGLIEQKSSQSIAGPDGDNGTIIFIRFRGPFKGEGFIKGLIWGNGNGPTSENPEEFLVKDDILVIISFNQGSAMGARAKEIIGRKLNV